MNSRRHARLKDQVSALSRGQTQWRESATVASASAAASDNVFDEATPHLIPAAADVSNGCNRPSGQLPLSGRGATCIRRHSADQSAGPFESPPSHQCPPPGPVSRGSGLRGGRGCSAPISSSSQHHHSTGLGDQVDAQQLWANQQQGLGDGLEAAGSDCNSSGDCPPSNKIEGGSVCSALQLAALQHLSLTELHAVEVQLEMSMRATREAMLQRHIAVASLQAAQQAKDAAAFSASSAARSAGRQQDAPADVSCCSICLERPRDLVFGCGHQSCGRCGEQLSACPFCRLPITAKIKLFDS